MTTPTPPEKTYQAIMRATYRTFDKYGYEGLTTRKVAEEFEKSRSTIRHYYPTEETLVVAFLDWLVNWYLEFTDLTSEGDPDERLRRFLTVATFGPETEFADFWAIQTMLLELRAQAHRHEAYRDQLEVNYQRITDRIAELVEEAIQAGQYHPADPQAVATLIHDAISFARVRKIAFDQDQAPAETYRAIEQYVLSPLSS
jgi:AcrR family transcriptional regulator